MLSNFSDYKGVCLHYEKILLEASTKRFLNDEEVNFLADLNLNLKSFKELYLTYLV